MWTQRGQGDRPQHLSRADLGLRELCSPAAGRIHKEDRSPLRRYGLIPLKPAGSIELFNRASPTRETRLVPASVVYSSLTNPSNADSVVFRTGEIGISMIRAGGIKIAVRTYPGDPEAQP